jgi:hypothetical protein
MQASDSSRGLTSSGSGSTTQTQTTTEIAHRGGYPNPETPKIEQTQPDLLSPSSAKYGLASSSSSGSSSRSLSGQIYDALYSSPPTSPETPTKMQLDEYRREHRFQSLGGAFRPLTSTESGGSITSAKSTASWWFGRRSSVDVDDLTGRPRAKSFETLLDRIGNLARKSSHRLSLRRHENSAIAEKKQRNRSVPNLPVYTRWRYKRNYRWVAVLVAFVIFFAHSIMPYIDWSLPSVPTHFPALYSDTSGEFHFTQRRLAGSPRQTAPVEEAKERGFKTRFRKKVQAVSGQNQASRHPIINGLLSVNMTLPVSAHPIKQLIKDAKVKWEAKNAKQSKTLKQAVSEYKRRNGGLNPPKGFDKWWQFVV